MFSCKFCEISENTFFTEHLWTTASILSMLLDIEYLSMILTFMILMKSILVYKNRMRQIFQNCTNSK